MRLQKLVDISQVLGMIAVVMSLIFIGVEINQNTKATRASIRQSIATNDITYLTSMMNSAVIAEANGKILDSIPLTSSETEQLIWQQYINFLIFETAYYNYVNGFVDPELWNRYQVIIVELLTNSPAGQAAYFRFKKTFTTTFDEELDRIISEHEIVLTE